MDTFTTIIMMICLFSFSWNMVTFVRKRGEEAIKAGIACIILLIVLFLLGVSSDLGNILKILEKIASAKGG